MSVDEQTGSSVGRDDRLGVRIGFADPVYAEVMDFVNREIVLLDRDLLYDWLDLLTEDALYRIPSRKTVPRSWGSGIDVNGGIPATKAALAVLVRRNLEMDYVYDQDPTPRIRRFVTTVNAYRGDVEGEYAVDSSILMLRNQYNVASYDFVSAERRDVLRRTEDGLRLARRTLLIDMAVLGAPIPNVIL